MVSLLRLGEDNVRVGLLAIVLLIYMLLGALMFHYLEGHSDNSETPSKNEALAENGDNNVDAVNLSPLYEDLRVALGNSSPILQRVHNLFFRNLSRTKINSNDTEKWDFPGSFHFVGTIVSTIGEYQAIVILLK